MYSRDQAQELAALYAAGALTPAEEREIEAALAAGVFPAADELIAFREAITQIAFAVPPATPAPSVRDRLLARLEAECPSGVHVVRHGEQGWRPTPYAGVAFKPLFVDRSTSMVTSLLRMDPGSSYPSHRHRENEQCLVLEGEVRQGGMVLRKGDFQLAEAGSEHGVLVSDSGCLLLLVSCLKDELLA